MVTIFVKLSIQQVRGSYIDALEIIFEMFDTLGDFPDICTIFAQYLHEFCTIFALDLHEISKDLSANRLRFA